MGEAASGCNCCGVAPIPTKRVRVRVGTSYPILILDTARLKLNNLITSSKYDKKMT